MNLPSKKIVPFQYFTVNGVPDYEYEVQDTLLEKQFLWSY